MVYQIIYVSEAAEIMPKSKLYNILSVSRRNNKDANVTGALIFVENKFIQILEGDQKVVERLVSKIKNDKRHKNFDVLMEGESAERNFPEWRMAYSSPNPKELAAWAGLRDTSPFEEVISVIKEKPGAMIDAIKAAGILSSDDPKD